MGYKTVLASLNEVFQVERILSAATSIARREEAFVVGLYAIPAIELKLVSEFETLPIENDELQRFYKQHEKVVRSTFESAIREAGVHGEFRVIDALESRIASIVVEESREADLTIVGYSSSSSNRALGAEFSEDVFIGSGRPTLVMPLSGHSGAPFERVLVGWNGSREAARAIFDSIPLLKHADEVLIASTESEVKNKLRAEERKSALIRALLRHGVKAHLIGLDSSHEAGEALLARAESRQVDLLVMGAYGHARLREFFLGGVTRTVLREMKCAVLFSH